MEAENAKSGTGAPKLEFFSDVKDKFFLILGGILSLATVIPAFLNSTSEIFGWEHIVYGYVVFVIIYFITPYVFYLFYCSIHDNVGYLELLADPLIGRIQKEKITRRYFELLPIALATVYLVWQFRVLNVILPFLILYVSLGCFVTVLVRYRKEEKFREILKEFRIIGTIIILIFGLFFFNIYRKSAENKIYDYSNKDQSQAFEAFDIKNAIKKDYAGQLDSVRKVAHKYRMLAGMLQPGIKIPSVLTRSAECDSIFSAISTLDNDTVLNLEKVKQNGRKLHAAALALLLKDQRLLTPGSKSLEQAYQYEAACNYLYDYLLEVQKVKLIGITKQWAALLKILQFKSLVWFFFLIMLGLCLWAKNQYKLKVLYAKIPAQRLKIEDNLGQVKSLIFLLFVLIVPWFRQIDATTVELDHPFINISLSGLAKGEYKSPADTTVGPKRDNPPVPIDTTKSVQKKPPVLPPTDTSKKAKDKADSLKTAAAAPPLPDQRDPTLHTIDSDVRVTQYLVRKYAGITLANPKDKKIFNSPPPKPKKK